MPSIAKKIDLIETSPIRKVSALLSEARERRDVISFGGGAPSLAPPKEVVEEAAKALRENPQQALGYTGTRGMVELLDLMSQDLKKRGGIDVDPKREILVIGGATEGILLALMAVVNRGDEVITMDPTYLGYSEAIKIAEGRVVHVPVYVDEGFQPDPEKVKNAVTKKTKAIILLSPDNPTGRIIKRGNAKAIVDIATDNDLWIICDDTYKEIVYEGRHVWVSGLPHAQDHTITICSFSKTASVPGFRLGYAYGPRQAIDAMEKLKQYVSICPDSLGQLTMIRFLSGNVKERYLREVVIPTYRSRRDAMDRLIRNYLPKAKTVKPQGAFYYFVDMRPYLKALNMTDEEFSEDVLAKKDVAIIPGANFGDNGRQHIRLTFVSETKERIEKGLARIREHLEEAGVA